MVIPWGGGGGTLPRDLGWGPGTQSPISKALGQLRKLTINQHLLRSYCFFHILYLMLSTPMEQGLLSVSLRSLVGKVRCWLMRSQAVIKPISIVDRGQCLDARKDFEALASII